MSLLHVSVTVILLTPNHHALGETVAPSRAERFSPAQLQLLQPATEQQNIGSANPILSSVESVRYLATFIDVLANFHAMQGQLDTLSEDDLFGRMAQLRVMASEADLASKTFADFKRSKNDAIRQSADGSADVFEGFKTLFGFAMGLYEQLIRLTATPHDLTEKEAKNLAESRITGSKLAAAFTEEWAALKTSAMLAFGSVVVPAPGDPDHVALDMSAAEKSAFTRQLRRDFGALDKQKTLAGPDLAAFAIVSTFNQNWRLAR
jgi:hypothetical protein